MVRRPLRDAERAAHVLSGGRDGLVRGGMRREVDGVRVDARLAGGRTAGEPGCDAHDLGAPHPVLPGDELVGGDADGGGHGRAQLRLERGDRVGHDVRDAARGADCPGGVVLVRLVDAEGRERCVAGKHLGHSSVTPEEGADLGEDPPLDHPQALGVELGVASGDLVELHVDDAHEAPVCDAARDRVGTRGCWGGRRGDSGRVERGVVAQDRPLELAQRRTRLEPVLVAQQRAELAIAGERIGLAPGPVQREQALALQPLAQGLCRSESVELGHQIRMGAERELGIHALLEHRQAALLESRDLDLREPRVGELGEGRSAPERERGAERVDRDVRVALCQRSPCLGREAFEALGVDLVVGGLERVARRSRDDARVADRTTYP